jgi:uncharacterized protein (UPF0210 family)
MKIRTITTGFSYNPHMKRDDFSKIAQITTNIKNHFQKNNYQVQTIRMSTQPWSEYATSKSELLSQVKQLDQWMKDFNIDYFNIGPTDQKDHISLLTEILNNSQNVFCTAHICNKNTIFYDHIKEAAKTIKRNATLESQGFANLRFATLCNISPNTPFYPASYHYQRSPSFTLGFENSDLVYTAFKNARTTENAAEILKENLLEAYIPIEQIATMLSKKYNIRYDGIDTSISTSIKESESIVYACEHLLKNYQFGQPGTLSIVKIITDVIQHLPILRTGYCGLMLPVLEDHGLSVRNEEGCFSITDLLLYSSICGTGLDTIPLPGDISIQEIENILTDVATLSIKLKKPLSSRLMPIPGKKTGDKTEYTFSYFKNSSIMNPR